MSLVFDQRPPAFSSVLHVGRPWAGSIERFQALLNGVFTSASFTNGGPLVRQLEEKIAALHGVKHCIAVSNGTIALQISLKAMGITGKVLMPAFTFIGTAHAASWIGLEPVFCDINPATFTLDVRDALSKMNPDISCILPVNLFGHACTFKDIEDCAETLNLKTLYDSAHCIGCDDNNIPIGRQGDMQILSFHATKMLHTFEGGAILTNNDELGHASRLMRNYGFTGYEQVDCLGTNAKMQEVSAAYGLACLPDLPEMMQLNKSKRLCYKRGLADIPGISIIEPPQGSSTNGHYVITLLEPELFGMERDTLYRLLWAENIRARRYFAPGCHNLAPYRNNPAYAGLSLPVTEDISARILCLPTGISITEEAIQTICGIIGEASQRADDVRIWDEKQNMAHNLIAA